jgi:hypothetical protein
MTAFTDKVVTVCGEELALFEGGALKEYDKAVFQRVGKYWDELAKIPDYKAWKGYNGRSDVKLELKSNGEVKKIIRNKNQPWSAAFISWVAKQAGAGDHFHYGPSHSVYMVKALREAKKATSKAKKATSTAKFIARRHTQYAPKAGDLIACERRSLDDATFDTYIDFVVAGRFEAHCDFIVGFNEAKTKIITIGGNVGNSVKAKSWPLNSKGHVGDRDPTSSVAGVVCIIECRL